MERREAGPVNNIDRDLRLTNSLRDSTALVDYAKKLMEVPLPEPVTTDGARLLAQASVQMIAVYKTLGVYVDGKVNVA